MTLTSAGTGRCIFCGATAIVCEKHYRALSDDYDALGIQVSKLAALLQDIWERRPVDELERGHNVHLDGVLCDRIQVALERVFGEDENYELPAVLASSEGIKDPSNDRPCGPV